MKRFIFYLIFPTLIMAMLTTCHPILVKEKILRWDAKGYLESYYLYYSNKIQYHEAFFSVNRQANGWLLIDGFAGYQLSIFLPGSQIHPGHYILQYPFDNGQLAYDKPYMICASLYYDTIDYYSTDSSGSFFVEHWELLDDSTLFIKAKFNARLNDSTSVKRIQIFDGIINRAYKIN